MTLQRHSLGADPLAPSWSEEAGRRWRLLRPGNRSAKVEGSAALGALATDRGGLSGSRLADVDGFDLFHPEAALFVFHRTCRVVPAGTET
jgi:hypothetical protein